MISQKELRSNMIKQLKKLDENVMLTQSNMLCEKLLKFTHNYKHIACFFPLKTSKINEVDLSSLVINLEKNGKKIYEPVIDKIKDEMYFVECGGDLIDKNIEIIKKLELVICPGIVFNQNGHRIGRGKGYYDKALESYRKSNPEIVTIGVGFDIQVLDCEWALNDNDISMDYIMFPSSKLVHCH